MSLHKLFARSSSYFGGFPQQTLRNRLPPAAMAGLYRNAVSLNDRNLREWIRSSGVARSFSIARIPILR